MNQEISGKEDETEEKKTDEQRENHGMKMFQEIGNKISESIKLEIDHPSNHNERKMPLLFVQGGEKEKTNSV